MNPWVDRAQVGATVLAAAALIFAGIQYANGTEVRKADLEAQMQERMIDLDRHFVDRPERRAFFYQNWPVPTAGPLRAAVLGTGEMIIDLAATIASSTHLMAGGHARDWGTIMQAYFCQSPAVRRDWAYYGYAYSSQTASILGAPDPKKLRGWEWRHKPDTCPAAANKLPPPA